MPPPPGSSASLAARVARGADRPELRHDRVALVLLGREPHVVEQPLVRGLRVDPQPLHDPAAGLLVEPAQVRVGRRRRVAERLRAAVGKSFAGHAELRVEQRPRGGEHRDAVLLHSAPRAPARLRPIVAAQVAAAEEGARRSRRAALPAPGRSRSAASGTPTRPSCQRAPPGASARARRPRTGRRASPSATSSPPTRGACGPRGERRVGDRVEVRADLRRTAARQHLGQRRVLAVVDALVRLVEPGLVVRLADGPARAVDVARAVGDGRQPALRSPAPRAPGPAHGRQARPASASGRSGPRSPA